MLRETDILSLRRREFQRHCLQMSISKNAVDSPRYSGSGFIHQDDHGRLKFVLYVPGMFIDPFEEMSLPPGELIPHDDFYTLGASDVWGMSWVATNILPDTTATGSGSVISGTIDHMTASEDRVASSPAANISLLFFESIRFPSTHRTTTTVDVAGRESRAVEANVAVVEMGEFEVRLHRRDDDTVVSLRASTTLPPHVDVRLVETLQFVLGRELWPAVVRKNEAVAYHTVLHSGDERTRPAQIPPAIDTSGAPDRADFWRLFQLYFRTIQAATGDRFHPLSAEWSVVVRSSHLSLESQVLVLSVSVEGLLRASGAFAKYGTPASTTVTPEDGSSAEWLARIKSLVEDASCPAVIRQRVSGFLDNYEASRAIDILRNMGSARVVSRDLVAVWKVARNPAAHGGRGGTTEELLRMRYGLLSLLYQLAFDAIGYRGTFRDYSIKGWPLRSYPVDEGSS